MREILAVIERMLEAWWGSHCASQPGCVAEVLWEVAAINSLTTAVCVTTVRLTLWVLIMPLAMLDSRGKWVTEKPQNRDPEVEKNGRSKPQLNMWGCFSWLGAEILANLGEVLGDPRVPAFPPHSWRCTAFLCFMLVLPPASFSLKTGAGSVV